MRREWGPRWLPCSQRDSHDHAPQQTQQGAAQSLPCRVASGQPGCHTGVGPGVVCCSWVCGHRATPLSLLYPEITPPFWLGQPEWLRRSQVVCGVRGPPGGRGTPSSALSRGRGHEPEDPRQPQLDELTAASGPPRGQQGSTHSKDRRLSPRGGGPRLPPAPGPCPPPSVLLLPPTPFLEMKSSRKIIKK